jgi:diguanylate cyclase (GGDEF)-like protein
VREVEAEARIGSLTEPLNRRAVQEAFEREAGRARRSDATLCIAPLDFDEFTAFNTAYGHTAGDELLRHYGHVRRRFVRLEDQLAHAGGNEFAALLPGCCWSEPRTIIARLAEATPCGQTVSWG